MADGPSPFALATAAQRAADWDDALRAGRFPFGLGRGEAELKPLEALIPTGNGWIDGPSPCASTWVRQYGFWAQQGQGGLAIQFHDGAICWYVNSGTEIYHAMMGAASKGKFIHARIYKIMRYQLVSN